MGSVHQTQTFYLSQFCLILKIQLIRPLKSISGPIFLFGVLVDILKVTYMGKKGVLNAVLDGDRLVQDQCLTGSLRL